VIEEEEAVVEAVPEVALAVEEEHQEEELEVDAEVAEAEGVELLVPRADRKLSSNPIVTQVSLSHVERKTCSLLRT